MSEGNVHVAKQSYEAFGRGDVPGGPVDRLIEGEDDVVLALGRYSGKGEKSGKALDVAFAHVWEIADEKLKRFLHYTDTAKFNEALS